MVRICTARRPNRDLRVKYVFTTRRLISTLESSPTGSHSTHHIVILRLVPDVRLHQFEQPVRPTLFHEYLNFVVVLQTIIDAWGNAFIETVPPRTKASLICSSQVARALLFLLAALGGGPLSCQALKAALERRTTPRRSMFPRSTYFTYLE